MEITRCSDFGRARHANKLYLDDEYLLPLSHEQRLDLYDTVGHEVLHRTRGMGSGRGDRYSGPHSEVWKEAGSGLPIKHHLLRTEIVDAISSLVRVAAVALALPVASCATTKQTTLFAVKNVSADTNNCLDVDSRQVQFACHRLHPGEMIAIAIREFTPSKKMDGSSFSKATVVVPKDVSAGDVFSLQGSTAGVFYSRGSSAFAGKKGCYGAATSGKIEVISVEEDAIEASIDVVVDMRSPLSWPGECERVRVQRTLRANWTEYDSLGAWEGKPNVGDTPFEEAHPLNN